MATTLTVEEIRERYMMPIERFDKKLGRKVARDYLQVAGRVLLFRRDHEFGKIETELVAADEEGAIFKATISTEDGRILATGYARAIFSKSSNFDGRVFEKAETAAIGRAFLFAGYGTDAAGDDIDESEDENTPAHYADSGQPSAQSSNAPELPAQQMHWYDNPAIGPEFVARMKDKYDLTEAQALELLDVESFSAFDSVKAAGNALLAAIAARDEAQTQEPAKPKNNKPAAKPAKSEKSDKDAPWYEQELEMKYLGKLLAVLETNEAEALKFLELENWSSFNNRAAAEAALRQFATQNEWPMIATGATYQQKSNGSGVITFNTPIVLTWHQGREKLGEMVIKHASEHPAEWKAVKNWKPGPQQFVEPIRILWGLKDGKPSIYHVEPAATKKIG